MYPNTKQYELIAFCLETMEFKNLETPFNQVLAVIIICQRWQLRDWQMRYVICFEDNWI